MSLKETARPCLLLRVSPASHPGPGTQSVPIIRTNEWRKRGRETDRLQAALGSGSTGIRRRAGSEGRRTGPGSDIPLGEGLRSWEEENCGLSGPRQRRLCREAAGRGAQELHASLPEGGRQKPSQRPGSPPRAAQLRHYPADTELLRRERDPVQLGKLASNSHPQLRSAPFLSPQGLGEELSLKTRGWGA